MFLIYFWDKNWENHKLQISSKFGIFSVFPIFDHFFHSFFWYVLCSNNHKSTESMDVFWFQKQPTIFEKSDTKGKILSIYMGMNVSRWEMNVSRWKSAIIFSFREILKQKNIYNWIVDNLQKPMNLNFQKNFQKPYQIWEIAEVFFLRLRFHLMHQSELKVRANKQF